MERSTESRHHGDGWDELSQEVQQELEDALSCEELEIIESERNCWERAMRGTTTGSIPAPEAALLLRLMLELAEKYGVSWSDGVDLALWALCQEGPDRFGKGVATADECVTLRRIAEMAGGWWTWADSDEQRQFVRLEEWQGRIKA